MLKLIILLFLMILHTTISFNIVGSYVSNQGKIDSNFPIDNINWNIYTHIRVGEPIVFPNGTAICNKNDISTQKIVEVAHKNNVKVIWAPNFNLNKYLWNTDNFTYKNNYLKTIRTASKQCNIDGIQIDYEGPFGIKYFKDSIIPPKQSTFYTYFLADLKKSLGKDKTVSCDVGVWGISEGSYPFKFLPWINVTMLNEGKFDFINTMSYHWNENGNIDSWKKDIFVFTKIWGINPIRINLGIPYFSINKTGFKVNNEPSWNRLSYLCPNIDINKNSCKNIKFIGKKMNENIGKLIKNNNLGGVFPWALNYDSFKHNNSLINWLYKGLTT